MNQQERCDKTEKTKSLKVTALKLTAGLGGIGLIVLAGRSGLPMEMDPQALRDQILSFGLWAPLVYILLFTIVPLTLFPDAVLAIAAGMAFGMVEGAFLTWIGAICGGSLAFWIARGLGRGALDKLLTAFGQTPHETPHMKGFFSILVLRLIPLVPFDVISYGAGLSHVRYRDFLAATALGILPGVVVYVNVGDKLFDWRSTGFLSSLGWLALLSVISALGVRLLKARNHSESPGTEGTEGSEGEPL